jgi:hypothetical protein
MVERLTAASGARATRAASGNDESEDADAPQVRIVAPGQPLFISIITITITIITARTTPPGSIYSSIKLFTALLSAKEAALDMM